MNHESCKISKKVTAELDNGILLNIYFFRDFKIYFETYLKYKIPKQLKQLLKNIFFLDLTEIYPSTDQLNIDGEETQHNSSSADSNKFMYVTGFIVALIVLIVSLVIHFLKGE